MTNVWAACRSKCTKCILEITETKSQETQRPRKPHLPDHNGCSSKSVKTAFYPPLSLFTIMETIPGNKCCCIRRSDILMVNLEVLFATLLEKIILRVSMVQGVYVMTKQGHEYKNLRQKILGGF